MYNNSKPLHIPLAMTFNHNWQHPSSSNPTSMLTSWSAGLRSGWGRGEMTAFPPRRPAPDGDVPIVYHCFPRQTLARPWPLPWSSALACG